jgi:hypothetical protein
MKIHQILINDSGALPTKLPPYAEMCVKTITNFYGEEEYNLYCGKEIEEIIKNNFDQNVFNSYQKLKPYGFKSDLARYCLLYLYGGLYIDLNLKFVGKLEEEFLSKLNFFSFRDIVRTSIRSWSVSNSIIFAKKYSPIMKKCIEIIIENCEKEYYGISSIEVTGCVVLGKAIMTSSEDLDLISTTGELCWIDELSENDFIYDKAFLMDDDRIIAYRKPLNANGSRTCGDISYLGFSETNNYLEMWNNKNVYESTVKLNNNLNKIEYY